MPFNFHYQGRYSGDETQLTGGRPLPPDARKLDEPDDVPGVVRQGLPLTASITAGMAVTGIIRMATANLLPSGWGLLGALGAALVLSTVLSLVHELVHALFCPRGARKELWTYLDQGALFIYCEAPMSKARFILMCLAPTVFLGFCPWALTLLAAPWLGAGSTLCWLLVSLVLTLGAVGDITNMLNVVRQVPPHAQIMSWGFHTYYLVDTRLSHR